MEMMGAINGRVKMISKELLSEVLNDGKYIPNFWEEEKEIIVLGNNQYYCEEQKINIYELAHKCKEWASSYGFSCMSRPRFSSGWLCELMSDYGVEDEQFEAKTEPEAIFQACQWILENKESKDNPVEKFSKMVHKDDS
jgi:hypothetical protein